jgi:hypothetical protein
MLLCAKVRVRPYTGFSNVTDRSQGMNTGLKFGLDPKVLNSMLRRARPSERVVDDWQT